MVRIGWRGAVLCTLLLSGFVVSRVWAQDGSRFFDTTGQTLDNQYGFLDFWNAHDGAALLGEPLTPIVFEANVPTQYFERGRLEQRGGAVAPGNLGRERTRWRSFPRATSRSERPDEQFFASTGWTANPSRTGDPQRNFRIRVTDRTRYLGVTFLTTSEPMAVSYWPAAINDDCRAVKISQGYLPETARFDPRNWHKVN